MATFRQSIEKMLSPRVGVVLTWIDQTHDAGQQENKRSGLFPGAEHGVCHAVVFDWLDRSLPYLGHGFSQNYSNGIPDSIRSVQAALSIELEEFRQALKDIERAIEEVQKMGEHIKSMPSDRKMGPLEHRGVAIKELDERLEKLNTLSRSIFRLSKDDRLIESGASLNTLDDLWGKMDQDGYYQVHLINPDKASGHAIGFRITRTAGPDSPTFVVLDPNLGEIEFPTFNLLQSFYQEVWEKYYANKYTRFGLAHYTPQRGRVY